MEKVFFHTAGSSTIKNTLESQFSALCFKKDLCPWKNLKIK